MSVTSLRSSSSVLRSRNSQIRFKPCTTIGKALGWYSNSPICFSPLVGSSAQ